MCFEFTLFSPFWGLFCLFQVNALHISQYSRQKNKRGRAKCNSQCVLVLLLNRKVTVKTRILFNLQQILFTFSHLVERIVSGFFGLSYSQVGSVILHCKTVVQTVCCQKNTSPVPVETSVMAFWLVRFCCLYNYRELRNSCSVSSVCISLLELR